MPNLSLGDRRLGVLLGLGDLEREPVCHMYRCACRCAGCEWREERVRELREHPILQPWDVRKAA